MTTKSTSSNSSVSTPISTPISTSQFVFSPPTPFDFSQPATWERWIQRFQRYREVSSLSEQTQERQITTLIYCMGEDAEDILTASNLSDADKKDYSKVKKMFADFFIGKRNVIYERAKFNTRIQKDGESVESFATDLRKLGEHCDYGQLLDEFIRDRIVIGIRDQQLSESLQLDADLTLEKALIKCRQKEAIRRQQNDLQNIGASQLSPTQSASIDGIQRHRSQSSKQNNRSANIDHCWNCGQNKHPREQCPAKNSICHQCQRKGHYAKCCKSSSRAPTTKQAAQKKNKIHEVSEQTSGQCYAFLGSVKSVDKTMSKPDLGPSFGRDSVQSVNGFQNTSPNYGPIYVQLRFNRRQEKFKADCGADVTIVPPEKVDPQR